MSRLMFRTVLAAVMVAAATSPASAQFYGGGGSSCSSCSGSAPAYSPPPVYSAGNDCCAPAASCTPIQPVYSACYQTVPVTTYKREKQTVDVPYYKTEYEDQEVTTYEPVSHQRTVEVPTVSYQTVRENRVVHRDMGRWVTNYQPIKKCAPCQVDPRPGMIGWLNRTGYSFRSAFVPNYKTSRQYVPKMMACNVPSTRQVAIRGTKKVVVNETRMVAKRTTQKVAVRKLAYRKETVTVARPVTAYRTVPIGSSLAYGGYGGSLAYGGYPSSSIAFVDDDDAQTALKPEPDDGLDAPRTASPFRDDGADAPRSSARERTFHGSSNSRVLPNESPDSLKPVFPDDGAENFKGFDDSRRDAPRRRTQPRVTSNRRSSDRPIVLSGWKASGRTSSQTASRDKISIPGVVMRDRD